MAGVRVGYFTVTNRWIGKINNKMNKQKKIKNFAYVRSVENCYLMRELIHWLLVDVSIKSLWSR